MKISEEILKKAKEINQKKNLESMGSIDTLKEVLRANLCPKCGEKITFRSLPTPQTYDDVLFYGEWNCTNSKCDYKLDYSEKERIFG